MSSAGEVAGLLLTGGASRRMGRDKALIEVEGVRLADRAATALSAVADPVVEVGPGRSALPAVREVPPGEGPLAALAAGGRAIGDRGHRGAVLVLATDLPGVTEPLLRYLAAFAGEASIVPVAEGRDQPLCARYSAEALETASRLVREGARAMRDLLAAVPVRRVAVAEWEPFAPPDAFADLDTPEDLARLLAVTRPLGHLWKDDDE